MPQRSHEQIVPAQLRIDQLNPGEMAIFPWWCDEHQCWAMPLPQSFSGDLAMCFCPGVSQPVETTDDLPLIRKTGHLIELQRRDKFDHPWRRPEGDQTENDLFFVTQATIGRRLSNTEWKAIVALLMEE